MSRRVPYPGLRAFQREESDLFFGRDEEIETIVELLSARRFLGVLGASGSGKSSLVRSGMIKFLVGGLNTVGSDWQIVDFHPGGQPIDNLAKTLTAASNLGAKADTAEAIGDQLRGSPRAIVQWCEDGNLKPGHALLIIADQFEELFNYNSPRARDEAHALASLLVESARSRDAPIYVVLTMRSDYFGHCGAFPVLAQAISDSIFLTPRMLRKQCREAIERPSRIARFEIDPELLNRLLNDLERLTTFDSTAPPGSAQAIPQSDQLPLLQYALNSMWRNVEAHVPEGKTVVLKLKHYDGSGGIDEVDAALDGSKGIGGITGALDNQGKATLDKLAESGVTQERVERVFRALVKGNNVASAVRDPHRIRKIADIAGLESETVTDIVVAFADNDCQFLQIDQPVESDSYVSISHESLIRQWGLLRGWLTREAEAAETWRSLARDASVWRDRGHDSEALLAGAQLSDRNAWWHNEHPTPAWVSRYPAEDKGGVPVPRELVGAYLDAGIAARDAARAGARKRQRQLAYLGGAVALVLTSAGSLYVTERGQYAARKEADASAISRLLVEANKQKRIAQEKTLKAQADEEVAFEAKKSAEVAKKKAQINEGLAKLAEKRALDYGQDALRLAAATNAANQKLLGNLVVAAGVLDEQQARPDGSASAIKRTALALTDGLDPGTFGRILPEYQRILARAEIAGIGADKTRAEGAEYLRRLSGNLSARPHLAAYLEGQAAEMTEDFPKAAQAYAGAFSGPEGEDLEFRYEAAAALIRIGRFVGRAGPADAAAWCNERAKELRRTTATPTTPADIAAYRCLVAAARSRAIDAPVSGGQMNETTSISWPGKENGDPIAETRLDRLRLRAEIALLNNETGFDQLDQVETYQRANPGSEAAANLLATLYENDSDELAAGFAIRQPFLEQPNAASAGFLLDSLPSLLKLDENFDGIEGDDGAPNVSDITPQAIKAELTGLGYNRLLSAALNELDRRHAPELPPDEEGNRHDRIALIPEIRRSGEQRGERLCQRVKGLANWNGLARDLASDRGAGDVYRSQLDLLHLAALLDVDKLLTGTPNLDPKVTACIAATLPIRAKLQSKEVKESLASGFTGNELSAFPDDAPSFSPDPVFGLDGRDPVALFGADQAMRTAAAPVRGRRSIQFEHTGGTYLFASTTNRDAFRLDSERYLPQFAGYAIDWLDIGERRVGNPRLSCLVEGKLVLFESAAGHRKCLKGVADGGAAAPKFGKLKDLWEASKPMPTLAGAQLVFGKDDAPVASSAMRAGEYRFSLEEGKKHIILPAGGKILSRSLSLLIQHADGSLSRFRFLGDVSARFTPNPGTLLPRGSEIAYIGSPRALIWTITTPTK